MLTQTITRRALSTEAKGHLPLPRTRPCASGFGSSRKRAPSKILRTQTLIAWLPALAAEVSGVLHGNTQTTMKTGRKHRRSAVLGTIYLLHFEQPYHHARHYLGWTEGLLEKRLGRHMVGNGARLVSVVTEAGIGITVARLWSGTRDLERKLKNRKNGPKLCPICLKNELQRAEQCLDRLQDLASNRK
jgi:hypothetical protein